MPCAAIDDGWVLYLDDDRMNRIHPQGFFRAYSSDDAIKMMLRLVPTWGLPFHMSLDHDLGGEDTTMVFLKRMVEEVMPLLPEGTKFPDYVVHSENPVGRDNIHSYIQSYNRVQEL